MSRDYKPSPEKPKSNNKGSPFLTGLLVGILLGIAASLSVVMFIKGGDSPFTMKEGKEQAKPLADKIAENTKVEAEKAAAEKAATEKAASENTKPLAESATKNTDDQTRFDFYTILPNTESKVTKAEESKIKPKADDAQPVAQKNYFLQVGAFATAEEADNLKAKLALQGFEAVVQTAAIPDKGIWHRVRVGPLNDLDQINKTKSELVSNGFNADLIKVNSENQ